MREVAFGELGMDYLAYARCTWANFNLKVNGYMNRDNRDWQRARFIAYNVYLSIPKKTNEHIHDFMPLPGDPTQQEIAKYEKAQAMKDKKWANTLIQLYNKQMGEA